MVKKRKRKRRKVDILRDHVVFVVHRRISEKVVSKELEAL